MRIARGWAVAGLAAAMTAGGAVPAQASVEPCPEQIEAGLPSTSVSYEFRDITEAVLLVPVPVERVRPLVPSRYKLVGEIIDTDGKSTGTATLVAAHGDVDALSVGCSHGPPATVSEYGVMIKSRDGKDLAGRNAYYLSLLTDNRRLLRWLGALGAPVKFAHGQFDVQSDSNRVRITAKETWEHGSVGLEATASEPADGPRVDTAGTRFWFDGPRGTIRTAYECPLCPPRSTDATGSVFGSGDSAVEDILHLVPPFGRGIFIRATLTATAELVD